MMEIFFNSDLWTIVAIAVSALVLHRAAGADRRRGQEEANQRHEAREKRLMEQIGNVKYEINRRFNRLEHRVAENHREVTASLGDMKGVVGSLRPKWTTSLPSPSGGTGQPGTGADMVSGAGVREPGACYLMEEPNGEAEGVPKSGPWHLWEGSSED